MLKPAEGSDGSFRTSAPYAQPPNFSWNYYAANSLYFGLTTPSYDATMPPLFEQLATVSPEHLAKDVTFAVFSQPCVTYLSFHLAHGTHHRGQLSAYLRPMGAKVPSIYGPSADENPFR